MVCCSRPLSSRSRAIERGFAGTDNIRSRLASAATPPRSVAPTPAPADVPTMISAVRGSHEERRCRTARHAVSYAKPAKPPAPSTKPIDVMRTTVLLPFLASAATAFCR